MCEYSGLACLSANDDDDYSTRLCRRNSTVKWNQWVHNPNVFPATSNHCVKGELTGVSEVVDIQRLSSSMLDEDGASYLVMSTGKFKRDIAIGSHVKKIIAVENNAKNGWVKTPFTGRVVAAECHEKVRFKRIKGNRDGESAIFSQHIDGEWIKWDTTTADEVGDQSRLWSIQLKLPNPIVKPRIEDFLENLEKPEQHQPEKPLKDDYQSRDDFRDAMRDYKAEVRDAKREHRSDMKAYKAELKSQMPEAKELLADAMEQYKIDLRAYKAELSKFNADSKLLAKAAAQCPRFSDAVCALTPETYEAGEVRWDRSAVDSVGGPLSGCVPTAATCKKDCVDDGLCTLKGNECVATMASCRRSNLCKKDGLCTAVDGACVIGSDADCQLSDACREQNKCNLKDKACVDTCILSDECKASGECGWVRPKSQQCEPEEDQHCSKSQLCKKQGYCSRLQCNEVGGCTLAGQSVPQGRAVCGAKKDQSCESTPGCKVAGLCFADKATGLCRARDNEACSQSVACLATGECSATGNVCAVLENSDCEKSLLCREEGRCTASNGACIIGRSTDCAKTRKCLEKGLCSFGGKAGLCVAKTRQDCASSLECWQSGKCTASDGVCVVGSKNDCTMTPACTDQDTCSLKKTKTGMVCVEPTLKSVRSSCDADDWQACVQLARRHQLGRGVAVDIEKSSDLLDDACDEKNGEACWLLGMNYLNGRGVSFDLSDALDAFKNACQYDEMRGCISFFAMTRAKWGVGDSRDERKKGLEAAKKACKAGFFPGKGWSCGDAKKSCKNVLFGGDSCAWQARKESKKLDSAPSQVLYRQAMALYRRDCDAGYSSQCVSLGQLAVSFGCSHSVKEEVCSIKNDVERRTWAMQRACKLGDRTGCSVSSEKVYDDVDEGEPQRPNFRSIRRHPN
tara:strand:- start:269 stop:2998 length:2730 start_codon:yes stop_codon:yes gene_type:complete